LSPDLAAGKIAGVAGLGDIGKKIAYALHRNGLRVTGWRRTAPGAAETIAGVDRIYAGHDGSSGLPAFLAECDYLVLVLPLTPATCGLIDARTLAQVQGNEQLAPVMGFEGRAQRVEHRYRQRFGGSSFEPRHRRRNRYGPHHPPRPVVQRPRQRLQIVVALQPVPVPPRRQPVDSRPVVGAEEYSGGGQVRFRILQDPPGFFLAADEQGFYFLDGPGQVVRTWVLDVDGTRVVAWAFHFPEATAEGFAEEQAILDSVEFEAAN